MTNATQSTRRRFRFGFDIGGTFTDFVLVDTTTGEVHTHKVLTTPAHPERAVLDGWTTLLDRVHATGADVESAVHATTLITNALLEGKGAVTALVTTDGFRDVLEMRREMRYDIYDLEIRLPDPLVPRPLRFEVMERIDARGAVVTPLDLSTLEPVVDAMRLRGVEACAVALLHAFTNDGHEKAVGAYLQERLPHVSLSLSSEVAPEIREFERTSTTVANAYVQPLTHGYLDRLRTRLAEGGYRNGLFLMLSNGGFTTVDTARKFPIRLVESGPAAGALAAVHFGRLVGERDLVAFDMGGTTAKICLIRDGRPSMSNQFEIGRVHRFKRGSGHPVLVPAIELLEIGAGGGSIARVDALGLLKVGPSSAGADPGPACYGLGGALPTVTDADVVLGYLDPQFFLGGRLRLDVDAARHAIDTHVARPLGMTVEDAAVGIKTVVDESMIAATRVHIAERNADPRTMRLVAFGGAGAVHADRIARDLKMLGYVCPASAGVASALGFLTAPASFEFSKTHMCDLDDRALADLDRIFADLDAEGRSVVEGAGVDAQSIRTVRRIEVRHRGQGHTLEVQLPDGPLASVGADTVRATFFARYEEVYGHAHPHLVLEVTTCRLAAIGPTPHVANERHGRSGATAEAAIKGYRRAYDPEARATVDTPVYDRYLLEGGMEFRGPAIVEQIDSTSVIGSGTHVVVDDHRNVIVTFEATA